MGGFTCLLPPPLHVRGALHPINVPQPGGGSTAGGAAAPLLPGAAIGHVRHGGRRGSVVASAQGAGLGLLGGGLHGTYEKS